MEMVKERLMEIKKVYIALKLSPVLIRN